MHKFRLSKDFVQRISAFLSSANFQVPDYAKSEYWQYHSALADINISGDEICVNGAAGYYLPPPRDATARFNNRLLWLARNPHELFPLFKHKLGISEKDSGIKCLNYFDAFDAVMNHTPIAEIDLAPYRIDYRSLREKRGVARSIEQIRQEYFCKDKYDLNPHIIRAYYIQNVICGFTKTTEMSRFLEIGAGSGLLAALIHHTFGTKIVIVDLPETLCFSMPFIADLFPARKMLMPHEIGSSDPEAYDFVFLTPGQIHILENNYFDLAVNISSFQEMTRKQIAEYFDLIQRCCKNGAYFLTLNRVEKIPAGPKVLQVETQEPTNRFFEYPWNPNNKVVIYEICKLHRLVQLDDSYIRLEQIRK